jgi:hypothetical protein
MFINNLNDYICVKACLQVYAIELWENSCFSYQARYRRVSEPGVVAPSASLWTLG